MTSATVDAIHQGRTFHVQNDPDFGAAQDSRPRFKTVTFTAPDDSDDGDTFDVDLALYGMSKFMGIIGNTHSTTDSVIIEEAPVTSVNGTVVTVAVGGSTDNKKRFFILYGI